MKKAMIFLLFGLACGTAFAAGSAADLKACRMEYKFCVLDTGDGAGCYSQFLNCIDGN